jgi:nucleoside-diphosphate-sugar epimerase
MSHTKSLKPRLLITGASGFIGRNVVALAQADNEFEIHCVSSKSNPAANRNLHWHRADLLNQNDCEALMSEVRPSHLLHLAWYTEHGQFWQSAENRQWVTATEFLAELFGKFGGVRAVFTGSGAEYDWSKGGVLDESSPAKPAALYGECKLAALERVSSLASSFHFSFAWARFFSVYGPGEDSRRFISYVAGKLKRGQEAQILQRSFVRDFLHVEDVAQALVDLLRSKYTGVVNIGSGEASMLEQIARQIAQLLPANPNLLNFEAPELRSSEPQILLPDISVARKAINFKPRFTLEQGLQNFIESLKKNDEDDPRTSTKRSS